MVTHIVFGQSAWASLKQALLEISNQNVISIDDNLMMGQLVHIMSPEYSSKRMEWWKQLFNQEEKERTMRDWLYAMGEFQNCIKNLNNDHVFIWVCDNAMEQTGLRLLLNALSETIPVSVIAVSSAFHRRYPNFTPLYTGEIVPEKLFSIIDDSKLLSENERRSLIVDSNRLLKETGVLRIFDSGIIRTVGIEYFDQMIMEYVQAIYLEKNDFFKCTRLVGEVIGHTNHYLADYFIEYRVRALIDKGLLSFNGSLDAMRNFNIKPT